MGDDVTRAQAADGGGAKPGGDLRKASEIPSAIELWFFRDLGDTARRQLFNWCGFPGVQASGEDLQRHLFRQVLAALATPKADPARVEGEAEVVALRSQIEELKNEAAIFDEEHADQNRMVDRIADLIGLPHDQELDTTAFELWLSALPQQSEREAGDMVTVPREPTEEDVERLARKLVEQRGISPDTLHQHHEWEDFLTDERIDRVDPFTREPRATLMHRAWRKRVPDAREILAMLAASPQLASGGEKVTVSEDAGEER